MLGVDADCDAAEAGVAFAQKARRARRDPDAPYDIEDLTWALHEIEQAAADPSKELLDFRVPADPAVYPDTTAPVPSQPLLERQHPSDPAAVRALEWAALSGAVEEALDEAATGLEPPTVPAGKATPLLSVERRERGTDWLKRNWLKILLAVLVLLFLGDQTLRASEVSSLTDSIERSEAALVDHLELEDAAFAEAEGATEERIDQLVGQLVESANSTRSVVASEQESVESFAVPIWHGDVIELRDAYADHADAWVEFLDYLAAGGPEPSDPDRIEDTWDVFEDAYRDAIPAITLSTTLRDRVEAVIEQGDGPGAGSNI